MSPQWLTRLLFVLLLSLIACQEQEVDVAPTTPVAVVESDIPAGVFISEILVGVPGNNNFEYIELFNAGPDAVDLNGWSLMYALPGDEPVALQRWSARTDIPATGYYLLTRSGESFTVLSDATFDEGLFRRGGLVLRDADGNVADAVGWGEVDDGFFRGVPAPAPENGQILTRLIVENTLQNSDDNSQDWETTAAQTPQNSGSSILAGAPLVVQLDTPSNVAPGTTFPYLVTLTNTGADALKNVVIYVPIPPDLTVSELPNGSRQQDGAVQWQLSELPAGGSLTETITLVSPLTYLEFTIRGYYAEAAGQRRYGPISRLAVAGGSIPISTARDLFGQRVTVEGIATMYTEGFFAGSGTKFYLQDETGGIQVYCPDGQNNVPVNIGDRVRVTGDIELYRTSVEIIPCPDLSDIEIVEPADAEPAAPLVPLANLATDESLLGGLYRVEGTIIRLEEFNFSYEIDLVDEAGNVLLVYIDKLTDITVDTLGEGQQLSVIGISEIYDGNMRLMPRLQADLTAVQPPELLIAIDVPQTVLPGDAFAISLTVFNYTAEPLTNIIVVLGEPNGDFDVDAFSANDARWTLDNLPANGGSVTLSREIVVRDDAAGIINLPGATATAAEWPRGATSGPAQVIVGDYLPIWAIQGRGDASPYVRQEVTTEGVVTGVFPELGGFWMQTVEETEAETETVVEESFGGADGDPATSEGIFVLLDGPRLEIAIGDRLRLTGQVRELSEQTTLIVTNGTQVTALAETEELPAAVELDPPAGETDAAIYYEALEGMLVQISRPALVVAPSSRFGEYALVRTDSGVERVYHGGDIGHLIFVDDGSTVAYDDVTEMAYAVATGDQVDDLVGPLAFTFGNFKIEPLAPPQIIPGNRQLPEPLTLPANSFSIATYNVENLFDTELPHPDSPPRPDDEAYTWRLQKTAAVITLMGAPTVVALQEVENIEVLQDLIAAPALLDYGYEAVLIEGDDSRGIDVGYLVRTDQATVVNVEAAPAPEGVTSRHPLILTLAVDGQTVYVINNHFTSMSGGEAATEPRRTAQAAWNVALVAEIVAVEPDAFIAVVGDLNSFYDSLPLDTLRDGGLRHVYEGLATPTLYSYIFEGESETLDHILVSGPLFELLLAVEAVHANADFPPADPADFSAQRASDHDPIVAVFALP